MPEGKATEKGSSHPNQMISIVAAKRAAGAKNTFGLDSAAWEGEVVSWKKT